jgi:DNA replication protein DnaC
MPKSSLTSTSPGTLDPIPEVFACDYCHDGGRVRVTEGDPRHPMFGKTILCPQCVTKKQRTFQEQPERVRAGVPAHFAAATLETWLPHSSAQRLQAMTYLDKFPPSKPFLFLGGPSGTGKTHLAIAVARDALERFGAYSRFHSFAELWRRYRATYGDDATESEAAIDRELEATPLLIIDDWGAESLGTGASEAKMYQIVDHRWRNGLPLIVTCNPETVRGHERILSRLADHASSVSVSFAGLPNWRQR